jgi:pyridoxine/pyridoxamine 5'-phosphate oxidase
VTVDDDEATDYRDLVIEDFADENARLRERVASLEADVVSYRGLVSVLLDTVHAWQQDPTRQHDRERRALDALQALLVRALLTIAEAA